MALNTRSKKPMLMKGLNDSLICASDIYNYMNGDKIIDCFAKKKDDKFIEFLKNRGNDFENFIIKRLSERNEVMFVSNYINKESCKKSIELIKGGIPILHSVPFMNKNYKGKIDLLVRSDYLNKLSIDNILEDEEMFDCSGKPYYIVVDIKYSKLCLMRDNIHLSNSGKCKFYKTQVYMYTQAVGKIQGYVSNYGFILGKGRIIDDKFMFGKINYKSIDFNYINIFQNAINWVNTIKTNVLIYPNMCINSGVYQQEKQKICDEIGEITSIWNVGEKERNIALEKGITNRNDINLNSSILGISGKRGIIIDNIILINNSNTELISPKYINSILYNWRDTTCKNLYIDFETISSIFFDDFESKKTEMIFMIGVGWEEDGVWKYTKYICNELTQEEEYNIINKFVNFINSFEDAKLFYWFAEQFFWNSLLKRHSNIPETWLNLKWCDLYKLFITEPIVIKGCYGFGLKKIAKAMYENNMITSYITSECDSGLDAMVNANTCYKCYKEDPVNSEIMKDIIIYNEFDCKSLWEILKYLRENN